MTSNDFKTTLEDFYNSYVVETVEGSINILATLTFGEMLISFLLLLLVILKVFSMLWGVIR